jgi:ribonuclease D
MTTLNGNAAAPPTTLLGVEHLHTLATAMTVAFDTETTGLQPERGGLRLLQLGARDCPIVLDRLLGAWPCGLGCGAGLF